MQSEDILCNKGKCLFKTLILDNKELKMTNKHEKINPHVSGKIKKNLGSFGISKIYLGVISFEKYVRCIISKSL